MKEPVTIIGGGISGITTAIVWQLYGHSTKIICKHWIGSNKPIVSEPRFASSYPAASIIPHSVQVLNEDWHMNTNLRLFECLHFISDAGIRKQRHYEVYEQSLAFPPYASSMPGYSALPTNGEGEGGVPKRRSDIEVFGWSFETLFAEMPRYTKFLVGFYKSIGGEIAETDYLNWDIVKEEQKGRIVVNCGGAWAGELLGDELDSKFVKGALVRVHGAKGIPWNLHTKNKEIFSYNYYPDSDIYSRPDGSSADVYFYPRTDGWLLGGTRLESNSLSGNGAVPLDDTTTDWHGEEWDGNSIELPLNLDDKAKSCLVPAPVIDLNRTLIMNLTGYDILDYPMTASYGYRHRRMPVRIESEEVDGIKVVHNYGHGGAGVTLSWSCAIATLNLMLESGDPDGTADLIEKEILNRL